MNETDREKERVCVRERERVYVCSKWRRKPGVFKSSSSSKKHTSNVVTSNSIEGHIHLTGYSDCDRFCLF